MELWIRSQDRCMITKVNNIFMREYTRYTENIIDKFAIASAKDNSCDHIILGIYEKERALEILDEIQKKMTQTFLLKEKEHINYGDMDDLRRYYRSKEINFVEVPRGIELEPINKDILVYEMPEV